MRANCRRTLEEAAVIPESEVLVDGSGQPLHIDAGVCQKSASSAAIVASIRCGETSESYTILLEPGSSANENELAVAIENLDALRAGDDLGRRPQAEGDARVED